MQATTLQVPTMKWETNEEFPGDVRVKLLRCDEMGGARTIVIHIEAGGTIAPHGHIGTVQHYVLDGSYETEGQTYDKGCFRILPGHHDVAPITSKRGATVMMIYDPIC